GVALRGTRHGERPARAIETALVIETMNLLRDGEEAGRLVLNDGAVFPAVPMPEYDLHEFVGAVVAQVVLDHLLAAHVLGFAVVERGDDVPGRASGGHQIEGREQARDMERLVIAGRIGRAEPEPLGRHAHDREHGDGIHLHAADAVAHRMVVVVPVYVGHGQPVIEEAEIELSVLEHPAYVPVIVRRPGVGARQWMAPRTRMIRAVLRLQKGDQDHWRRSGSKSTELRASITSPPSGG